MNTKAEEGTAENAENAENAEEREGFWEFQRLLRLAPHLCDLLTSCGLCGSILLQDSGEQVGAARDDVAAGP